MWGCTREERYLNSTYCMWDLKRRASHKLIYKYTHILRYNESLSPDVCPLHHQSENWEQSAFTNWVKLTLFWRVTPNVNKHQCVSSCRQFFLPSFSQTWWVWARVQRGFYPLWRDDCLKTSLVKTWLTPNSLKKSKKSCLNCSVSVGCLRCCQSCVFSPPDRRREQRWAWKESARLATS